MKKSLLIYINHFKKSYHISKYFFKTVPKRLKFALRAVQKRKDTEIIFNFFSQTHYSKIISHHPSLYNKIFRSYLYCGLPIEKKCIYLLSHYQYMMETFEKTWINTIYDGTSAELLNLPINNENIIVELCYIGSLGKEGEIALSLCDKNKNRLYSIAFSFLPIDGELHIFIGGMQGYRSTEALETLKSLTKSMHGLRPRNFLIFIMRAIGQILNAKKIKAVTTKYHVSQCSKTKETGQFCADYDLYWEEEGGIKEGATATLPLEENRKSFDQIKSNKRSMYTKRYAMLDEITESLKTKLPFK